MTARSIINFAVGGASIFGRTALGRRAMIGALHGSILGGTVGGGLGMIQGNPIGSVRGGVRGAMVGGIAGGIGGAFGWRGVPTIGTRLHPQLRAGLNRFRDINPVTAAFDEFPV